MSLFRFAIVFLVVVGSLNGEEPEVAANQRAVRQQSRGSDYYTPLTDYDKQNIRYIIGTLSQHSAFSLMFYKSSLEEVGARTSHIHPLKHLRFIFSDSRMRGQVGQISRIAWNRFVKSFGESLSKVAARGEITEEMVQDFTKTVGVDLNRIEPLVKRGQWSQLMQLLVANSR